jgi:hypothetical protein
MCKGGIGTLLLKRTCKEGRQDVLTGRLIGAALIQTNGSRTSLGGDGVLLTWQLLEPTPLAVQDGRREAPELFLQQPHGFGH